MNRIWREGLDTPLPSILSAGGGFVPPTKFSKREDLTRPSFLAGERER